jgi:hypothetical protein
MHPRVDLQGGMQRRRRLSCSSHLRCLSHWHMPHRYVSALVPNQYVPAVTVESFSRVGAHALQAADAAHGLSLYRLHRSWCYLLAYSGPAAIWSTAV